MLFVFPTQQALLVVGLAGLLRKGVAQYTTDATDANVDPVTSTATCDTVNSCSGAVFSGCDVVICSKENFARSRIKIDDTATDLVCCDIFSCFLAEIMNSHPFGARVIQQCRVRPPPSMPRPCFAPAPGHAVARIYMPTRQPSLIPSLTPTVAPSSVPSLMPSTFPTLQPSMMLSATRTLAPSSVRTRISWS